MEEKQMKKVLVNKGNENREKIDFDGEENNSSNRFVASLDFKKWRQFFDNGKC